MKTITLVLLATLLVVCSSRSLEDSEDMDSLFVSIALLVLSPGLSAYVPILQHAGVVISESFVLLHVVSADLITADAV
ncbi:hypothetical protein ABFA07_006371 [Porites harrisoni]